MDRCERCRGPIERTEDDKFLCPRCGIWVHLDGAELGPPITPEQAGANYERFVIETAAKLMESAKELKGEAVFLDGLKTMTPAARFEMLHDWYAPMDENGERQPGMGIITREEFLRMMDAPDIDWDRTTSATEKK